MSGARGCSESPHRGAVIPRVPGRIPCHRLRSGRDCRRGGRTRPARRCPASSWKRAAPRSSRGSGRPSPTAPGIPHRKSAAGALHGDLQPRRLEPLRALRHRADGLVHGDSRRADSSVAPFTDAVTIIGQVPPVDVHSSTHEMALGGDIFRAIPTVRSYNAVVAARAGRGHECERHRDRHGDDAVSDPRRPDRTKGVSSSTG